MGIIQKELLELYNNFFTTGHTTPNFSKGIIVCIPKGTHPKTVADYRTLTLLNSDYKIYARIIANRIKQTAQAVIHETQYSATSTRNILDAATALRDVIAAGSLRQSGMCLVALDFQSAFNISYEYLYGVL